MKPFGGMEEHKVNELQQRLAQPFDPKYLEWKPGSTTKDGTKCMAMPYADMRAYMERLDELFGLEWSVRYVGWGDSRIFCELTINGVTRTSTGESDAQDAKNGLAGTVAEAQAFKRACAMFGLGRYLYDLPSVWVAYDSQYKRISDQGKAELDSRYRQWYAKATQNAQNARSQPQRAPVPATEDTDSNGDVLFSTEQSNVGDPEFLKLYDQFDALGEQLYGAQWGAVRKRNVVRVSGGKVDDSMKLSAAQIQMLIDGMNQVKAKRNAEKVAA